MLDGEELAGNAVYAAEDDGDLILALGRIEGPAGHCLAIVRRGGGVRNEPVH